MASARAKGKIPHSEWPKILARYSGGETIASIGRDYGCTAPAIRYIVKRSGNLRDRPGRDGSARPSTERKGRTTASADAGLDRGARVLTFAARVAGDWMLGAELRRRVTGDVASFLVALDQAMIEGSSESVVALQDATDRLMRSTARVRLELERLGGEEKLAATRRTNSAGMRTERGA
jgi:hypothetical protein